MLWCTSHDERRSDHLQDHIQVDPGAEILPADREDDTGDTEDRK